MHAFRRTLTTGAATLALLGITATGALAHQCYVVERSAQGAVAAGQSGLWFTVSLEDEFRLVFTDIGLSGAQLDEAVDLAMAKVDEAGLPTHVAIFGHHTLMAHMGTFDDPVSDAVGERVTDGRGIDWIFEEDGIFATFEQIVGEVLGELTT